MPAETASARRVTLRFPTTTLGRGIAVGAVAGLAGTAAMHLFGVALFRALRWPVSLPFSITAAAAAATGTAVGLNLPARPALGLAIHYVIGLALGAGFGVGISRSGRFHPRAAATTWLGIAYAQGASVPLLLTGVIALRMSPPQAARWWGMSIMMHLVYGGVLGTIFGRAVPGQRLGGVAVSGRTA